MLNVGSLVNSREFAQSFTVYRKSNATWVAGRLTQTETPITFTGTITVPSEMDLEQIPEGDRQKGAICVYSQQELVVTNLNGTSDEILWRGNRYRASQLSPMADYGYYKCIAIKMDPATKVGV